MQLVEEATEGCWIGHRARMFTSEIGSVYSPPKDRQQQQQQQQSVVLPATPNKHVETVIDVGHSEAVCVLPPLWDVTPSELTRALRDRAGRSGARRAASAAYS